MFLEMTFDSPDGQTRYCSQCEAYARRITLLEEIAKASQSVLEWFEETDSYHNIPVDHSDLIKPRLLLKNALTAIHLKRRQYRNGL